MTNIEANACGTPAVASDVPGLRESVVHGKSGLLFEYGNTKELSDSLAKILSNHEYREKLRQGGLDWARTFNWDEAAEKTFELIQEAQARGR